MKLRLLCTYCGHIFIEFVYTEHLEWLKCSKCGDKKLKHLPLRDVFGYDGKRHEDAWQEPKKKKD